MDIAGYFSRQHRELRMPRGKDSIGIRWGGPVLSGVQSLEERLREDRLHELMRRTSEEARLPRSGTEIRTSPGGIPIETPE